MAGCLFWLPILLMRINGRLMRLRVDPEQYTFFSLTDRVAVHAT